jgi:ankyrin repeat protein
MKMKSVSALIIIGVAMFLAACSSHGPKSVFDAVWLNDARYVQTYLERGGDPNAKTTAGESLLYLATGPKGGRDVVRLLLDFHADPNLGADTYTPLMNASSWLFLDACKMLIESGADPDLRNSRGQSALECVGSTRSPLDEEVRIYLSSKTKPNPSL